MIQVTIIDTSKNDKQPQVVMCPVHPSKGEKVMIDRVTYKVTDVCHMLDTGKIGHHAFHLTYSEVIIYVEKI